MTTTQKVLAVFEGMMDSAYEEYLPEIVLMIDVLEYADGALDINLSDAEARTIAITIEAIRADRRSGAMTSHQHFLHVSDMLARIGAWRESENEMTLNNCTHEPISLGRPKIIGGLINAIAGQRRVQHGTPIVGCARCHATLVRGKWVDNHSAWRVSVNGVLYWHSHPMSDVSPAERGAREVFAAVQVRRAEESFAAEVARRAAQREAGSR